MHIVGFLEISFRCGCFERKYVNTFGLCKKKNEKYGNLFTEKTFQNNKKEK